MDGPGSGQERWDVHCSPMAKNQKKRRRKRNDPQRKEIQAQREEARRRLVEQRRREAEAAERRTNRLKQVRRFGLPALAGIAVFAIALLLFRPERELPGVQRVTEIDVLVDDADEPRPLAASEIPFDYATATPTSGPFLTGTPSCGVFDDEISPEEAATAIYHGAVVLWYQPSIDAGQIAALSAIVADYDAEVLMSPNASLESPIVATAFNRLKRYDSVGNDLALFADVYRGRGPGDADCPS